MPTPILATKLYTPPPRPGIVQRPRLIERLNIGLVMGRKLTLISASAGFGKTTLVSEWITDCGRPVAWLSLDERDNGPIRFISYLVSALQTIKEGMGEGLLAALQSPQPPSTESILTTLLNEIAAIPDNFVLVLDDYHVIDSKSVDVSMSVDQALTFLIEHQPPQMHLVIATREDPHLPLARLRARGQLSELRAADLRFTPAEAAEFLNQVMGLKLRDADIEALEARTDGWIAGLQLAALAMQGLTMQGREDITSFIQAFTGSHSFVLDYLVEEVLQQQPEHIRSFLLQTSILDSFCAPLCNAVAERGDGKEMLDALERSNLFLIPLDDQRQWYRYHHLFADVLQAHLIEAQPDQVLTLHRRASDWYELNDLPADAIRHALAAKDYQRAAGLVELAWPAWHWPVQSIAWLGWVNALPDELISARPVLSVAYAQALLNAGKLEAAEARLLDAERWLKPISDRPEDTSTGMVVVDDAQFQSLPVSLATVRAYHAQAIGDWFGTVVYTRRVLDLLPEEDHSMRGSVTMLLGLAHWANGNLEAAHRTFSDGVASIRKAGHILYAIDAAIVLADIKMVLGHLHEAVRTCEHALQLAAEYGEPLPQGTEDVYTEISTLHREQGDLEAAAQDLATSKTLGEQVELPDWQHRWCIAQARLKETLGDLDSALDLLDEAERLYVRTPLPNVRPIAAMKTRVWVAQGRLTEARGWVRERGLSVDDDLSYLHEFEHITLARVLSAAGKSNREAGSLEEATWLLERLLKAAEEGGRTGSMIEILVLQALSHQAQGKTPSALMSLKRALTLAEPEGYVRIFVDEGKPMAELLTRIEAQEGTLRVKEYVLNLLSAFDMHKQNEPEVRPVKNVLVEPLSQREREVLRLLRSELSGPEIARELMVSLNTVRTHTQNIYAKLGVNNRRAAVRRAEEFDLL
jgi:LuxR family transcriptional regulator, maltose regulon positive regulatory protein